MHLFLTSVLPFLAHDHPSAVAFLTCRHDNFHASIIPEFLSDEERVKSFCKARQQNQLEADEEKQYKTLYNLFVQTPLMQFSPSLIVSQKDCTESILKPLLATKYFSRSLQRCSVASLHVFGYVAINNDLLQGLSKVQSLTELDLGRSEVENHQVEIIVNAFPSLEILTIDNARKLKMPYDDPSQPAIKFISPPPPATKTLRSLRLDKVDALFVTLFVPHFTNLKKLGLEGEDSYPELDVLPLSSSLPLLTDLSLEGFTLINTESLKNLVLLSTLRFTWCRVPDLSFLTQENSLPHLTTLHIVEIDDGLSTSSFASLSHAPNLLALELYSPQFNDDCLQYLESMVHLRKLDLSSTSIVGDSQLLKNLMQNLFQLEELNLSHRPIGRRGVIAGALFSTHSRLRVLDLYDCDLVDDDLNGIGALKKTLEVLDLASNGNLTSEALVHCNDLEKLKVLKLAGSRINDLSPLKDCLNLEKLDFDGCDGLTDDSCKVFSEEPNSFPNLCFLGLSNCERMTEKVFEHLSKNNNFLHQLKRLDVEGMSEIFSSSPTAQKNLCQLKGLRSVYGVISYDSSGLKTELARQLRNIESLD